VFRRIVTSVVTGTASNKGRIFKAMHFCEGKIRAFRNGQEQRQPHEHRCGEKLDLTDKDGEPVIWEYVCTVAAVMKGFIW